MLKHIKSLIDNNELREFKDHVLVAVSGGKDSVVLLDILVQLKPDYDLVLTVVHFDHQLRKESKRDARFVQSLAENYNVSYFSGSENVRLRAQREKRSIEDAARQARYQYFEKMGQELQATKLAMGHTLSDQVETFFLRLLRGAGLQGLSSIPIKRPLTQTLTLIRPLLHSSSTQIYDYINERNLQYREDATNNKTIYARNKIRHELLPWLIEEFNPNLLKTISRTQQIILQTNDFLDSLAELSFREVLLKQEKNAISSHRKKFLLLDRHMQSLVLRKIIRLLHSQEKEIGFDHIETILDCLAEKTHFKMQLPDNLLVEAKRAICTLRIQHKKTSLKRFNKCELSVPGTTSIEQLGYAFKCTYVTSSQLTQCIRCHNDSKLAELVDFDKIKGRLQVRTRRPGDRFKPFGLENRKKLQDFFVDLKISREERDRVALICDAESIIWVVGYRISEAHRVDSGTKKGLLITARLLKGEEDEWIGS